MKLDLQLLAEYAARFSLTVRPSDGEVVVHFYDKHGSLYDILDASQFAIAEPTPAPPAGPRSFDAIADAFDYCREKNQPVTVILHDTAQGYNGTYKLWPSGKAEQLGGARG